jgi:class 3 adenylate cyclase
MPLYMDRHDLQGVTAEDVAHAHVRDLQVQSQFGVRYLSYWFDYDTQAAFCLVDSPTKEAAEQVHRVAHGLVANRIIEVDPHRVEDFLGAIRDPSGGDHVETAFRAILFTDIEGSTALTQRLGDGGAMRILRRHDEVVRAALRSHRGHEVKHTGDGIMGSFTSATEAVESAHVIQRALTDDPDTAEGERLRVRIGLSAGEPVTERGDLFGAAVQLAARLCVEAPPGEILASSAVRDLSIGKGFTFQNAGELNLKGFDTPIRAYLVRSEGGTTP